MAAGGSRAEMQNRATSAIVQPPVAVARMCARDSDECDIGGMQIVSPNGSTKLAYGFVSGVFGCAPTGNNDEVCLSRPHTLARPLASPPPCLSAPKPGREKSSVVCACVGASRGAGLPRADAASFLWFIIWFLNS